MPHKCVHCSRILPAGSKEILEGCQGCGGRFFFYIRDEVVEQMKNEVSVEFNKVDKKKVEEDVRTILKIEEGDKPVILDIESVRVVAPGKFEIDLASLMNRKPVVFKLEEGKYIIDLSSLDVGKK